MSQHLEKGQILACYDLRSAKPIAAAILFLLLSIWLCSSAQAQGSIFGSVRNHDLSIPDDSQVVFFGFLNQSDNEIRVCTSDGAGYDNGNWFDDFQNYLDEAPGIPYDYLFFNQAQGEYFRLSKLVPNNSFQQEDIQLSPASFPSQTTGLTARVETDNRTRLRWSYTADLTYHIYRRTAISNGSLFRVDNPAGDLSDFGVADSMFLDTTVADSESYSYMIISQDAQGNLAPPSAIVTATSSGCCVGLTGNVDNDPDDLVDIGDVSALVDHLFITFEPLVCPEEANIDGDPDGLVDISDITWLIDYLFITFTPPSPCR